MDPNLEIGPREPTTNLEVTTKSEVAKLCGQLQEAAKAHTMVVLNRKMLEKMRKEKVGNPRIEKLALWSGEERGVKVKKRHQSSRSQQIQRGAPGIGFSHLL